MAGEASSGTFLQGLERGLAVIRAFSASAPALTLSEVAREVGITPATARRILLTLEQLGYVRTDGRQFSLTPRVLALGWAYLSSLDLGELAGPFMEELSAATRESCSIATLDLPDIVYVARVPTSRIMTVALGVGARLPAYPTSMGRVLLAGLPPADLDAYLADLGAEPLTDRTVVAPEALRAAITAARADGYSLVDQELELGLRSIAVPIHNSRGRVIAALNVSAHASRSTPDSLCRDFLPHLHQAATQITTALTHRGPL
ncbi:helix-turn-helix domain-containing protein [Kribbella sandramycini]|uniref:Helix-turn-helix domain-containing protein n=1 Tax=Kribbella sandramycini TaxID=60450 RepID=A0A7Y4KZD0_9ACTN|nr:IclR family transcriptional regulator C-terminal domain-containing protein [Kribbella sandramycini]MBB6565185.1 IclR family pca regulon transcriptional regulator [Kribbella sandramycini]NOL41454.1 helix-turn-helix domain-containing protein [Kribbella sandramycini]